MNKLMKKIKKMENETIAKQLTLEQVGRRPAGTFRRFLHAGPGSSPAPADPVSSSSYGGRRSTWRTRWSRSRKLWSTDCGSGWTSWRRRRGESPEPRGPAPPLELR